MAATIPLAELARLVALEAHRVWPLAEVANITGFSQRWLEKECRADRLEHTHEGHTRGMTVAQIGLLVASRKSGVTAVDAKAGQLSAVNQAVAATLRSGASRTRRRAA